MIGGAVVLVIVSIFVVAKYNFDEIEGFHFSAKTNDDNREAAFLLIVCVIGAAALFHFGTSALNG
jgi:hypothetical protein